jgi:hypothetical protein
VGPSDAETLEGQAEWHEAVYYAVVESYRDETGTPRHRTVETLGTTSPGERARLMRSLARDDEEVVATYRAQARMWPAGSPQRAYYESYADFRAERIAGNLASAAHYDRLQRKLDARRQRGTRKRRRGRA